MGKSKEQFMQIREMGKNTQDNPIAVKNQQLNNLLQRNQYEIL